MRTHNWKDRLILTHSYIFNTAKQMVVGTSLCMNHMSLHSSVNDVMNLEP